MSPEMNQPQTVEAQVRECRNVQEALLVLARNIDMLAEARPADPFEQPIDWGNHPILGNAPKPDGRSRIVDGEVVVSPVSQDRQLARAQFAHRNRLDEFYGPGLTQDQFVDAYVKGGPRWLYYTNDKAIRQMPLGLRQQLVADVMLDSPDEAAEISRDICKFDESMSQDASIAGHRSVNEARGPA